MSARFLTTADAEEWERALPASRSAFGSLGFARVQERAGGPEPRLLIADTDACRVAYPLGLRSLGDLPFTAKSQSARADSVSPPFTGPIVLEGEASPESSDATEEIATLFHAEGVVAEFAHLHPWGSEPALVGGGEPDREIVWVDVAQKAERLWESYSKACRKNIRRAGREGVVVRVATIPGDVAEFHRIYTATMERNEASEAYLFDEPYFQAIFEEMPDSARFVLAERGSEVIAATLYLHDDDDVYSYLGGADHAHQQVRPTNAVVHETIAWAREAGKKRLILGGGYRADDGIFRFKASFSPLRATLELARRVHLRDEYDLLVEAWRGHYGDAPDGGYFPAYRQPPPGTSE